MKNSRPLYTIATEIRKDWGQKVNYGALPYLNAMSSLTGVSDKFGLDDAKDVVLRFLCNASTWRGETAKRIKNELKEMVK